MISNLTHALVTFSKSSYVVTYFPLLFLIIYKITLIKNNISLNIDI